MDANSSPHFETRIKLLALHGSRHRKLDLMASPDVLDAIPSTPDEMTGDWNGALAQCLKDAFTSPRNFSTHDESSLKGLSVGWLDDVKNLNAYNIWRSRWKDDGIWSPDEQRASDFNEACREIHDWLADERLKQDVQEFREAKAYLQTHYFHKGTIQLRKSDVEYLISRKAARIWEATRGADHLRNWTIAERYVETFYSNIVPAVEEEDAACIGAILSEMQNSCGTERRSLLVNGLEAALAIRFFNRKIISAFEKRNGQVI